MKLKNISLLTTILLLVAVIAAATYAYFSASIQLDGNIGTAITTAGIKPAFTSAVNGEINLNINIADLNEGNIGNVVSNGSSSIDVSLLAGAENGNVTCTYDIEFVWEGDAYTATTNLPVTQESKEEEPEQSSKSYQFELSLQGKSSADGTESVDNSKNLQEVNLDKLSWKDGNEKKIATVVDKATISNASADTPTKVTWTFELKFYVLPSAQNKLLNKQYKGHLVVANVIC